jgi:hypothetical protein
MLGAIIGGGMALGGMMGSMAAADSMKKAIQMRRQAAGLFDEFSPPTPEEMYVALEDLQQQGIFTPEMAQAVLQDQTAMAEIQRGGAGREAQLSALEELRNISGAGGLTAMDRAKIQEIQDQLATTGRGAREAVTQEMAQRGVAGSGLDYMNRLMAAQSGAETAARQGTDVAALAEQRALEALLAQGQLGGQISGQEFAEQADIAKAKDLISQFNTANRQNVELENIRARNLAQQQNLAEQQRVADYNTAQLNAERLRRANLTQQQFENQMAKTQAKAAALTGTAQAQMQAAQQQQQFYGGLLGAGGQIIAGTAPYWGGGSTAQATPSSGGNVSAASQYGSGTNLYDPWNTLKASTAYGGR